MAAIPAQVAGVREILRLRAPGSDGRVSRWVLAAAGLLGLGEVYAVGERRRWGRWRTARDHPARGQDRWPWQRLRDRGEARGLWRRGRGRSAGAERGRGNSRRERLTEMVARDLLAQAEHLSGSLGDTARAPNSLTSRRFSGEASRSRHRGPRARPFPGGRDLQPLRPRARARDLRERRGDPGNLDAVGMVALGDASPVALADYGAGPRTPCRPAGPRPGPRLWAPATSQPAPTTFTTPARRSRRSARASSGSRASRASRTTPRASRCACAAERERWSVTVGPSARRRRPPSASRSSSTVRESGDLDGRGLLRPPPPPAGAPLWHGPAVEAEGHPGGRSPHRRGHRAGAGPRPR